MDETNYMKNEQAPRLQRRETTGCFCLEGLTLRDALENKCEKTAEQHKGLTTT